ncbi:hypothetical protein GCM10009682_51330 [Luedemannella flava]|uniref:Uncharacterized protein n=1 Tax=Luedemannella flava TaxID=349316 RepID=A0ABN2MH41_9ACTN
MTSNPETIVVGVDGSRSSAQALRARARPEPGCAAASQAFAAAGLPFRLHRGQRRDREFRIVRCITMSVGPEVLGNDRPFGLPVSPVQRFSGAYADL